MIFREGDDATEAYLLEEGRVRLVRKVGGIERSLVVLRPNDLFGETALLDGAKRSSAALAVTDSVALALDQSTFRKLLETSPSVAIRVMQQLTRRLRDAEDQVEFMMLNDPQSRIVNALIKLAQANPPSPGGTCLLDISPIDLSTRVALDIETVRRGVQKLRDLQYVRIVQEKIEIQDIQVLIQLHSLLALKEEICGRGGSDRPVPPGRPATT